MVGEGSLSLEALVRRYNIVDSPVVATDLETGMVLHFEGRLRIVISATFENSESGPMVIVETWDELKKFAGNAQLDVWHINGEPFIVEAPEDPGPYAPGVCGGSSMPPVQDAAGIVPVWRGPKRLNQAESIDFEHAE